MNKEFKTKIPIEYVNNSISKKDSLKPRTYYLGLLKDYLINSAKTNSEIDSIVTNEDGSLQFNNRGGFFLSIYNFNYADIITGDINNDNKSDVIISITNEGGGGGGNVSVLENYSIIDNEVSYIEEIQNLPNNEFGYLNSILKIENNNIVVKITFYKEDDLRCCPNWEEKTVFCKLKDYKLVVVNK